MNLKQDILKEIHIKTYYHENEEHPKPLRKSENFPSEHITIKKIVTNIQLSFQQSYYSLVTVH